MDTAQPQGRLKAFLKHATVRISSGKGHGSANDSASTYSIDDDGRSQMSSTSSKKDSKLRRLGRGIREWRSKRRRLHGDTRLTSSHTLGGKSFSSSDGSFEQEPFEIMEDFTDDLADDSTDEDERVDGPENYAVEGSEDVRGKSPDDKVQGEAIHEEVVMRQSPTGHHAPREIQNQVQPTKGVALLQAPTELPPPPACSPPVWTDLAPHEKGLNSKPNGVVLKQNRKCAVDFAQSSLSNAPTLWTDASHYPAGLESRDPEHRGAVAVAQKLDRRLTVHSAYTGGIADTIQFESLAILMALQRAVQEKRPGLLAEGTVYISSDSAQSLQWIEKVLAIATTVRGAAQEARALETDVADLKRLIRLCDQLDRWKVLRLSGYSCPEKSPAASIGRRMRSGPEFTIRQPPRAEGPCQLIHPPSDRLVPEGSKAIVNPSTSFMKRGSRPNQNSTSRLQHHVALIPLPQSLPALPQPQSKVRTRKNGKKSPSTMRKSMCTHCGNNGHLIHQCFEKFPEQKVAFPQRYAHYEGRERLEKAFLGAFQNLARLHPQLMSQPIHGQDSRYIIGRIGISPHLTLKQYATRAVRCKGAKTCHDATSAESVQDQRQHLREKRRCDEAQGAEVD